MKVNFSISLRAVLASACLLPGTLLAQKPLQGPPGTPYNLSTALANRAARLPGGSAPLDATEQAIVIPGPVDPPASITCNLVGNPTFNSQIQVPSGTISNVPGSTYTAQNSLATWHCTDEGTADYFATNAPAGSGCHPSSSIFGAFTPHNFFANSRNGCAGLYARSEFNSSAPYRENIAQQLGGNLLAGSSYYVSFWALLAPGSQFASTLTLDITANDPTAPSGTFRTFTRDPIALPVRP